jgi:hypothetical protein
MESMKNSDIAKIAASVLAGQLSMSAARDLMGDDDHSILESLVAGSAGIVGGAIGGSIIGSVMDETGISEALDDLW